MDITTIIELLLAILISAGLLPKRLANQKSPVETNHRQAEIVVPSVPVSAVANYVADIDAFAGEVLPAWANHIELSRQQMEQAISELSEEFAGITQNLNNALINSRDGLTHNDNGIFDTSNKRLREIVVRLDATFKENMSMLEQTRSLAGFVKELKEIAKEVARTADQTNLIALNAAIEAARARGSRARLRRGCR